MSSNGITPTENRIYQLLLDGHPHRLDELKRVIGQDDMEDVTVWVHISNLRKKLRLHGQDVSSEKATSISPCLYRLVRLTASHARNAPL